MLVREFSKSGGGAADHFVHDVALDDLVRTTAAHLRQRVGRELPLATLLSIHAVAGDRFVAFVPESREGGELDGPLLGEIAREVRATLDVLLDTERYAGLSPRVTFRVGHALLAESPYFRFERRVHAAVAAARGLPGRVERAREVSTGEELRRIIEDSDVSAVFQPVVDLGTRDVLGFEAFARGPKDSDFEAPRSMFACSGRLGVGHDLDRLCRDVALRACEGFERPGKLFLNVLPESLEDPEWRNGRVAELLSAASLCPSDVVLELSERDADARVEATAEAIRRLRERGFAVALDDVGTGYASLGTLDRLRPDFVKVDGTLVRAVHRHPIQQEALSSLAAIASRLGAELIAEGVETNDEASALRGLGFRYGQGYLFREPGPLKPGGWPRSAEPEAP